MFAEAAGAVQFFFAVALEVTHARSSRTSFVRCPEYHIKRLIFAHRRSSDDQSYRCRKAAAVW